MRRALASMGSAASAWKNGAFGSKPLARRPSAVAEIEAKAVETAVDHPAPQRADRHVDDQRAVEREAIAGAGVVDVKRRIARVEAEPGRVVEAAERQRRPELVALAVVVEDDVENRLHARRMQRVGRRANLRPAAGSKPRIGRAEHHGIIAPCVREAERRHMPLVDEGVGRHDLDRGDAERGEMRDRRGMREPGEGSARGFGDGRVEAGKAAQVELVNDERFGRDALVARLARGRRARRSPSACAAPLSSPNANIEGWRRNGRSKRQA